MLLRRRLRQPIGDVLWFVSTGAVVGAVYGHMIAIADRAPLLGFGGLPRGVPRNGDHRRLVLPRTGLGATRDGTAMAAAVPAASRHKDGLLSPYCFWSVLLSEPNSAWCAVFAAQARMRPSTRPARARVGQRRRAVAALLDVPRESRADHDCKRITRRLLSSGHSPRSPQSRVDALTLVAARLPSHVERCSRRNRGNDDGCSHGKRRHRPRAPRGKR